MRKEYPKVKHLKSSLDGKYPTNNGLIDGKSILEYGEIAINYYKDNEFMTIKNTQQETVEFKPWNYISNIIVENENVTAETFDKLRLSCGFNNDYSFIPDTTTTIINSTTSIKSSLTLLDHEISSTQTYVNNEKERATEAEEALGKRIDVINTAIESKNVSAEGETGESALVTASATGNKVAVGTTAKLQGAVASAETALQAENIATGSADGTISVKGNDVAVKGLGSAAYTESSAYDTAGAAAAVKTAIEGELAETDAKTLAALNDRIDEVSGAAKTYEIVAVTEGLGENVKEAFKLVDEDGTQAGATINIYKDSSLKEVKLVEQKLQFTYILANGEESTVSVDVSKFLAESEFGDGLKVTEGVVSVEVDTTSESFLTVGENGVKLSGVEAAINEAVAAKNVDAEGDAYVTATAANNKVTVAASESTKASLALADSAVQEVTEGTTSGTISVDGTEVAVHGLGSAAYTNSDAYDAAGTAQGLINGLDDKYLSLSGGEVNGETTIKVSGGDNLTNLEVGEDVINFATSYVADDIEHNSGVSISRDGINLKGTTTINGDVIIGTLEDLIASFNNSQIILKDTKINGHLETKSITQTSDMTLKKVVSDIDINLDDIVKSPIFKYNFIEDDSNYHIGTSAQYWKEVLPELVYGEEGNYSLEYGVLGTVIGVKLANEIANLKEENKELKEELNKLKLMVEKLINK